MAGPRLRRGGRPFTTASFDIATLKGQAVNPGGNVSGLPISIRQVSAPDVEIGTATTDANGNWSKTLSSLGLSGSSAKFLRAKVVATVESFADAVYTPAGPNLSGYRLLFGRGSSFRTAPLSLLKA